ncbi:MAG: 2-amino-4-hydroxy-6-hydroxymethyldihydropteridine diphosphokinase [Muribaculaceae bacterium]|nr:2-amino-4-hydroxy-6-hydroxymethyldihydropteridine diphosphokinase [Muribaculaceae bacterium]
MNGLTVICIGSNVGDKYANVAETLAVFRTILSGFQASDIYESDDDSGLGQPYANAVCAGFFNDRCENLHSLASTREKAYGRTPESKASGIMPLDIDIVVFNNEIVNSQQFDKPYFRHGLSQLTLHPYKCLHTHK